MIGTGQARYDVQASQRPKRFLRMGGLFYPEACSKTSETSNDGARTILDTALQWWTFELEQAEHFFGTEEWQSGQFGKDRPTLRSVYESLRKMEEQNLDKM